MPEIRQTEVFAEWFAALKDRQARRRIQVRIDRLEILAGGDKATQDRDIATARELARNL